MLSILLVDADGPVENNYNTLFKNYMNECASSSSELSGSPEQETRCSPSGSTASSVAEVVGPRERSNGFVNINLTESDEIPKRRSTSTLSDYATQAYNSIAHRLAENLGLPPTAVATMASESDDSVTDDPDMVFISDLLTQSNELLFDICQETGLDAQDFQCEKCKRPIGLGVFEDARLCDYTGRYFCSECHINDFAHIPARIVHNWDFTKRKVCKGSKRKLDHLKRIPLIDLRIRGPGLYIYVEEAKEAQLLRRFMWEFVKTCKEDSSRALRQMIWPREYLMEQEI